jgi:Rrf2 family protein
MISNTCKIAIKAVIYLCSKSSLKQNAGIKEIAGYIGANEHTVGKVLQILVRRNIIKSMKGPSGGFYISDSQQAQPVIQIVEAIDGDQVFTSCGLGLSKCSSSHPCPIHHEYKKARDVVEQLFRQKKVSDLCEPVSNGVAYLLG